MSQMGRVAWPALEEAIRLLRDASDWNPALKSAAGGLAHVLSIIRLRSDNRATCEDLLRRIVDIARDLTNQSPSAEDVRFRLERFERCLLALTDKLRRCHGSGKITSYLRAQRDAKVLLDCDSELNATVDDMKLFLHLTDAKRGEAIRQNSDALLGLARQNQEMLFNQSQRVDEILHEVLATQKLVRCTWSTPQPVQDLVLWRIEFFSLLGQRCALERTQCGRTKIDADVSIVLFV